MYGCTMPTPSQGIPPKIHKAINSAEVLQKKFISHFEEIFTRRNRFTVPFFNHNGLLFTVVYESMQEGKVHPPGCHEVYFPLGVGPNRYSNTSTMSNPNPPQDSSASYSAGKVNDQFFAL